MDLKTLPEGRFTLRDVTVPACLVGQPGHLVRTDIGIDGGLIATLTGQLEPLSDRGILSMLVRRPLGSVRVLALIHWQALKLWAKGAKYRTCPTPPEGDLSR